MSKPRSVVYICCFTGCHSLLRFEGLDRDQRHCWKVEVERNGLEGSNAAKCRRFVATAKSAYRGIDGIIIRWSCLYAMGAECGVEKFKQRMKVESGGNINESDQ